MTAPSLPYPGHRELHSGRLSNGRYRVAYSDISPTILNYVSNITISKGHRLVSGFFGFGLLISGLLDRMLGLARDEYNITVAFGLLTSLVLIFICLTRNITIAQLMKILENHIQEEGYAVLTHNPVLKQELSRLKVGDYKLRIPSPFLMLVGVELVPVEK